MFYRIGLDIGIASVGWCVVETDQFGEPKRIIALGSRIFDKAEKKQKEKTEPVALQRRLSRGMRRRLRRRAYRMASAKALFLSKGVIPSAGGKNVNALRVEGLDKALSPQEFAAVLMLLIKRRGFLNTRIAQTDAKEEGKLKKAVDENEALMKAKGYRTVGEMLVAEFSIKKIDADGNEKIFYNTRNKGGEYVHSVKREALRDEIEKLFEAQKSFGNILATNEIRDKVLAIFLKQVNADEGPGKGSPYSAEYKVGKCTLIPEEERAPKCSVTFERCTALQKVNHLRIVKNGSVRPLTAEEREKTLALVMKNAKTEYQRLRKELSLTEDERFYGLSYYNKKKKKDDPKEAEKKVFVSFERSREIMKCLSVEHRDDATMDGVAYVLSHAQSDEKRLRLFETHADTQCLTADEKNKLLALNGSKFGHISVKAASALLPYLQEGARYDEACKSAGFEHTGAKNFEKSSLLEWNRLNDELEDITSPLVKRAVSQTIKVLNAIIRKYGEPVAINVELARDMSKSAEQREKIEKEQRSRQRENNELRDKIKKEFGVSPTKERLDIYRLYEEQGGRCPYTDTEIDINRLFEGNYVEVDHILPYSRSFNDSFSNKVLVKTKANRDKGSRTPFEWLFTTDKWNNYFDRVCVMYAQNTEKKTNLLRDSIDEKEMKTSALNDTRYVCRFMLELIGTHLKFADCEMGSLRAMAVKGMMTAALRWRWGIGKVREDGDLHHAVDAAVIACMTPLVVQKLSVAYKAEHEDENENEDERKKKKKVFIAEPYKGFADELAARCLASTEEMRARLRELGVEEDVVAEARPVFVSRMPKRKARGPLHEETINSVKYAESEGIIVTKVPITKLRLGEDKEGNHYIARYFRPEDDRRTYELLLSKLIEAHNQGYRDEKCAQHAFTEKVYKPTKDGRAGNEIKKVKLYSSVGGGAYARIRGGAASNDTMVRVDVFSKKGKYYCVPVYARDIYAGVLPQKAVVAHKNIRDWDVIDDTYNFEFALYKNDLVWIKPKSGITFKKSKQNEKSKMPDTYYMEEGFVYFTGFDSSDASITVITHDNCYERRGLGTKTIPEIKKCSVDVLGNISFVKGEKRPPASMKKESEKRK